MAEKATGKAQGRSRPQAQSRNQGQNPNRQSQQKGDPDTGRGGSRGARNGAASGGRAEQGQRQGPGQEEEQDSSQEEQSQESGGVGAAAGKVGQTLKQHPITTAAIGAGLTLLAAQGLRMAIGASGGKGNQSDEEGEDEGGAQDSASGEDEAEQSDEEGDEGGGGFSGRLGRLGSKFGNAFRGSGQAIKRGASSGYERGRQGAEQGWSNHPLLLCGVALAVGAAAGYLIPSTSQEDRFMGKASDKLTGRIKKGGQAFFRQGRSIAGKVVHEAVSTTSESIEREGLSPDRLGKKVKKVLGNVREAVSNAIEED